MEVKAIKVGYLGNVLRNPGDVFNIPDEASLSEEWMLPTDPNWKAKVDKKAEDEREAKEQAEREAEAALIAEAKARAEAKAKEAEEKAKLVTERDDLINQVATLKADLEEATKPTAKTTTKK